MEKQKIVLIITIILLIGIIMTLSGYILLLNQQTKVSNNTTNNTAVTNNTTNFTPPKETNKETNYIGEAAAKQKAIEFFTEYGIADTAEIRSIDFVTINRVPLYSIKYWDHYIMADGTEHGWDEVLIGAKDGRLYDDYGKLVTT